jgi:hypothetical protein
MAAYMAEDSLFNHLRITARHRHYKHQGSQYLYNSKAIHGSVKGHLETEFRGAALEERKSH